LCFHPFSFSPDKSINIVPDYASVDEILAQMKAIKQYFLCFLFCLIKVVLSVDKTLVWDHLNESYSAVLSCGNVYYADQVGSNF